MAKKSGSDEIFQLIHSLTAEEKGYFKKFAKRYSEKEGQLPQLFDVINLQTEYDEDKLKSSFASLAVLKAQLFDQILDSLLLVTNDEDYEDGLWKKFKTISLLHQRGLTERALRMNAKALAIARQSEVFPVYERLLKQRFNIAKQSFTPAEYLKEVNDLHSNLKITYQALEKINLYYFCFSSIHALETQSKTGISKTKLLSQIPELRVLLNEKEDSLFFIVKRNRLNALAKFHYVIGEHQTAQKLLHELLEMERKLIDENNPAQRKDSYYYTLNGLIYNYYSSNNFKEALKVNEYARTLQFENKELAAERNIFYCYNKLILLFEMKDYKGGEEFATSGLKEIKIESGTKKSPALASIIAFKILFEWINGNFKQLFKTLTLADEVFFDSGKPAFISDLELMRLLVHLDAGNHTLAKRNATKLIEKKGISFSKDEKKLIAVIVGCAKSNRSDCFLKIQKTIKETKSTLKLFNIAVLNDLLALRVAE
jgi:hypothetical protein